MADDKSNLERAGQIASELGERVRKAGSAVAGEVSERVKKMRERRAAEQDAPPPAGDGRPGVVEETVGALGDVATETGRAVRKVAGRLGSELRKRIKR